MPIGRPPHAATTRGPPPLLPPPCCREELLARRPPEGTKRPVLPVLSKNLAPPPIASGGRATFGASEGTKANEDLTRVSRADLPPTPVSGWPKERREGGRKTRRGTPDCVRLVRSPFPTASKGSSKGALANAAQPGRGPKAPPARATPRLGKLLFAGILYPLVSIAAIPSLVSLPLPLLPRLPSPIALSPSFSFSRPPLPPSSLPLPLPLLHYCRRCLFSSLGCFRLLPPAYGLTGETSAAGFGPSPAMAEHIYVVSSRHVSRPVFPLKGVNVRTRILSKHGESRAAAAHRPFCVPGRPVPALPRRPRPCPAQGKREKACLN